MANNWNTLQDWDKKHVWHPFDLININQNLAVEKAQGCELFLDNGDVILDAIGSWWVNIHGHAHPEIASAIASQAHNLEHVIFAGFTHKPAIELAKSLLDVTNMGFDKVFFSDNGSTAVEVALKMSFQYWYNKNKPKTKIVAFENAYHGDTFGAMSVGGRSKFNEPFLPFLFDVQFIEIPTDDNIESLKIQLIEICKNNDVAAFIFEPLVQGAAGMQMYKAEHLSSLIEIVHQHEVLAIADEVMTGFGRTGTIFASHQLSVNPDIICLSKGITGGFLPLGITLCADEIYQAFNTDNPYKIFFHGHSYTANPIVCAAANASLKLLLEPSCKLNIERISTKHTAFVQEISTQNWVKNARSCGTILAIEFQTNTASSYFNSLRDDLYHFFLEQKILLRPLGNIIYVIPPYVISDEQLERIYAAIRKSGELVVR
ncbi:MAG: adenosylmethionine--8-amino-7-oxononanoate transaminase [Bacteroidota bacterium]|jgi:adenosylmethionine-8-amino-7-oxononanoate aminotransferase